MDISISLENNFISYQESQMVDNYVYKDYDYIRRFIIKYYKNKNQKIIIKSYHTYNIINSEMYVYILNNEIYVKSIYMILNSDNSNLISNINKYNDKVHFKYLCIEKQFNKSIYPFRLQYIVISTERLELFSNNIVNKVKLFNKDCNKYGLDYLKFGVSLYDTQTFVYELKNYSSPYHTINIVNKFSKLITEYNKCFKKHNQYKMYDKILKIYYGNNSQEREVQFLIEFDLVQENYLILNTIINFESNEYINKNINNIFNLARFIEDNYKKDNTELSIFYKLLIILMKEKKHVFNNSIFLNNGIKVLSYSNKITKTINKFNSIINIIYDFNKYDYNKFQFLNLIYSEEIENEIQKVLYYNNG